MPVRRRMLCAHMRVDHDQSAEVPFWWTDLQVRHAVRAHWRQTMRLPFGSGSEPKQKPVPSHPGGNRAPGLNRAAKFAESIGQPRAPGLALSATLRPQSQPAS